MRVIAGKYRGKKLKEFNLSTTRPTMDRVKESMFNLIQFKVTDAEVLDLFAGTGALGIEAISRGAAWVDFVDSNPEALKIVNGNLMGIDGKFKVHNCDYLNYLQTCKKHYDIILLDPPFALGGGPALEHILTKNTLKPFGNIIFETPFAKSIELKFLPTAVQEQIANMDLKTKIEFAISGHNYAISKRKYGISAVYWIEQIG